VRTVLRNRAAWEAFVTAVHAGLEAVGIERDYFSVYDLQHLARARYTAAQVVALARAAVASDFRTRTEREAARP